MFQVSPEKGLCETEARCTDLLRSQHAVGGEVFPDPALQESCVSLGWGQGMGSGERGLWNKTQ